MLYLGIDPGKSGGIAAVNDDGKLMHAFPFTKRTERDIYKLFAVCWETAQGQFKGNGMYALIEGVSASPQMGRTSAFTFGRGYGFLRGCLIGQSIAFEEVAPGKWQKAMKCLTKGDKNVTKQRAEQLFPGFEFTHAIADAAIIAEYNRRTRIGATS